MDLEKLREITEKLERSQLLKGMAYQVLDTFIKQQEEAITVTRCCKPQGTVKTIDFDKAKNFMINYMKIDNDTKHVVSMAHYTKTVTVKEFFEIMQNAFEKAIQ